MQTDCGGHGERRGVTGVAFEQLPRSSHTSLIIQVVLCALAVTADQLSRKKGAHLISASQVLSLDDMLRDLVGNILEPGIYR